MAHTKDTQVHYPAVAAAGSTANPLSLYLNCADDCTLVVLDINWAANSLRTGGAPTINGQALTQVPSTYRCTEISGEKWFASWSHFVALNLPTTTIPGSLEIRIPNSNGRTLWGVAHTYKAGAGKVSVFDVSTYKTGTTATANPSGTIFPTDANGLVTVTAGFGANTVPTSMHTAITTLYSHDPSTYTFFEGYRLLSAVGSVRVNFTMASDDWGWVLAAFKEADAPVLETKWTRLCSSVLLNLPDTWTRSKWGTRPVAEAMPLLGDSVFRQSRLLRNWTDGLPLFDGDLGTLESEYANSVQDALNLTDSVVRSYVHEIVGEIIQQLVTDTLDLTDSVTRRIRLTRALIEWLSLSDSARRAENAWARITDTLGLTDQEKHWAGRGRAVLDALFVFDASSRRIAVRRWTTDVLTLLDSAQKRGALALQISEWLSLSDSQRRTKEVWAGIVDSLALTDAEKHLAEHVLARLDVLFMYDGDTGTLQMRHEVSALDVQLPLSDSIVRDLVAQVISQTWERTAADTLGITDTQARRALISRAATHWLSLSDNIRRSVAVWRAIVDRLGLTDAEAQELRRGLRTLDVLVVFDNATRDLRLRRGTTDGLGLLLSDATVRNAARTAAATDQLSVSDRDPSTRLVSGAVTQANMRLSVATDTAFADFSAVGALTRYLNRKLTITDSAGKKLVGYIKAAGTGETYGSELSNSVENTGSLFLTNATAAVVGGGHSGDCLQLTSTGAGWGTAIVWRSSANNAPAGGHYLISIWSKEGTGNGGWRLQGASDPWPQYWDQWFSWDGGWSFHSNRRTQVIGQTEFFTTLFGHDSGNTDLFDDLSITQVLTPSATGVTVTSAPGGTSYNWASEESGFNRNDENGYTYEITATGSVTQANMRLSIAAGVAFADFGISGLFAYYLGGKLIVTDSAGKKLVGYLKALGTGETYGSELTGSSDFESTTGWWGGDGTTELSVVAGGQSGNCMRITNPVQDWSQAGATSDLYTKGGLYRVSAYLKSDGGAYYSFSLHEGVSPYTKLTPDSSGSNGSWTLYALYGTILETSASNFLSISTGPMGTFRYVDTSSVKQVLTPSATGVTVTSTPGGTSYNWESEESGFNRNDSSGYTFEIQEASLFSRAEYSRFSLDTLPLSDSIVREYVKAIIAGVYLWENTDTLLLADTVVRQTALTQSTLEWLRLDDTARRSKEARRAVTEGLTLTDLQRRLMERNLSRLDAVFVFDSTKRELRLRRNVSDAMTLFDQIQRRCAASIVSMDTVLLTDNAKRQFVRQARLGDVLPLSDTRVLSVTRMLTALDSLLVGDRVAQLAEAFRKAVEYLAPLADSISAEGTTGGRTYTVQAFDVLDVVDNSGRRAATTRSVMDALAVGDLAGAARSLLRQVADALGIRDERSAALVIQRATVDWLLLTDTRSRRWWHTAIITDRIGLSDAHAAARKLTVFESTVLSDATSATYIRAVIGVLIDRAVTDALAVSDAAVATHFMERKTQDALGVSDTVARRLASARFTLDVLRLDDSVVRTFDHFLIGQVIVRAITDTLDVLDLLQMERKFRVTQTDAVLTADRLARAAMLARVGSDLLDLADLLPSEQRERRWSETDALVLDDRLTRAIDLVLAESVLVTDTLTHTWMQAVVTVLSGIKERVATYLSVKASIRNPLARLLSESHLLPSWSVMRNPLARHVDTIVPYLRTVEVVDMNAAHL